MTEIGTDTFVNIASPLTFTIVSGGTALPIRAASVPPVRTKTETEANPVVTFYANRNEAAAAPGPGAE